MQFDTMLKLGSLALGVAQDEKVRELATIIHKGAKRRGMLPPPGSPVGIRPAAPSQSAATATTKSLAAPGPAKSKPSAATPPIPFAPSNGAVFGGASLGKLLTVDNAKKALDIAGVVKGFLVK